MANHGCKCAINDLAVICRRCKTEYQLKANEAHVSAGLTTVQHGSSYPGQPPAIPWSNNAVGVSNAGESIAEGSGQVKSQVVSKREIAGDRSFGGSSNPPAETLKILISGVSGSSKSVVINGILGQRIIPERSGVYVDVREEKCYEEYIQGIRIQVRSTAVLQNQGHSDPQYLKKLKSECHDVDLIVYCIKATTTRFLPGNPDELAIKALIKLFGSERMVFALTCANLLANNFSATFNEQDTEAAFNTSLKDWEAILHKSVGYTHPLPKVIPTGHYNFTRLPGHPDWLTCLWIECINAMSEDKIATMVNINCHRLKHDLRLQDAHEKGKYVSEVKLFVKNKFELFKESAHKMFPFV